MKKPILLLLALVVMMSTGTVSANDRHDVDHRGGKWQPADGNHPSYGDHRNMPFSWHEKRDHMSGDHRLDKIHDKEFRQRFHGLTAYRWHDGRHRGFWHNGHYITQAVLFFDRHGQLIQFGYMHDNVFIVFRADNSRHEHHDRFFADWHRS